MTVESQNLMWRPMAVSDGAAMADLLNAIDAEDHVWGQYTAQDAAEELDSQVDDLPTSTLAVFDGATMLDAGRCVEVNRIILDAAAYELEYVFTA